MTLAGKRLRSSRETVAIGYYCLRGWIQLQPGLSPPVVQDSR